MLQIIHSTPEPLECPSCGSDNIGSTNIIECGEGTSMVCHDCGCMIVIQDYGIEGHREADVEVTASFSVCPHCKSADEIQVMEGTEWCSACGLDPNKEDHFVKELAHLWAEGSGIRKFMERGLPRPGMSKVYRFLTQRCGPHCSFGAICPQETENFTFCLKEEIAESGDPNLLHLDGSSQGTNMGRGKNKKRRKAEKERIAREKQRAAVKCSASGWYQRNLKYTNETKDPQESSHTGSGSGT